MKCSFVTVCVSYMGSGQTQGSAGGPISVIEILPYQKSLSCPASAIHSQHLSGILVQEPLKHSLFLLSCYDKFFHRRIKLSSRKSTKSILNGWIISAIFIPF